MDADDNTLDFLRKEDMDTTRKKLPVKQGLLHRPRVDRLFAQGLEHSLVTVIAGVGYGKTQAVASYARNLERRLVWLGLVTLDNHARRFWEHFVEALANEMPLLASNLAELDFPDTVDKYDVFLRILAKEIYKGARVVMVVDDYHCINNDAIKGFFDYLIESDLENFCLVIISSEKSSLGGDVLRSNADVFSITAEDLAFTAEEISDLFHFHGTDLPARTLRKIADDTGGWPLALYLLNMQYQKKEGRATINEVSKFLPMVKSLFEAAFFHDYDDDFKRLLVKLSLCSSFSNDMVKEIGGCDFVKAAQCLYDHMFIAYDQALHVHTFQKMYHQFLAEKQPLLSASEKNEVYRIAGDWFFDHEQHFEAVSYYHQCGNYDRMLEAIMKIPRVRWRVGASTYLLECMEDIPEDFPRYNLVIFCRAHLYLNNMDVEKSRQLLEGLRDKLEAEGNPEESTLLGETYIPLGDISILRQTVDFSAYFQKAHELLPNSSWVRNPALMYVGNSSLFFLPSHGPGQREAIVERFCACAPHADAIGNGCGYGLELLFTAEAAFLSYRLESAREYCYRAIYKAQEREQHDIICNAYFLLMRIYVALGDGVQTIESMQRIVSHIDGNNLVYLYELRDFAKNWFYLRIRDEKKVTKWLAKSEEGSTGLAVGIGRNKLTRAYFMMAQERYTEAAAMLEQMDGIFTWKGLWTVTLFRHLMLAQCYFLQGDADRALDIFLKAYEMSHDNFITAPFIEFGDAMCDILDFWQKRGYNFDPSWCDNVRKESLIYGKNLAAVENQYKEVRVSTHKTKVRLTSREQRVLNYLAEGLTREMIATNMRISVNGIKWHITNIYTKLGAINRADAIYIAMSKGYIK